MISFQCLDNKFKTLIDCKRPTDGTESVNVWFIALIAVIVLVIIVTLIAIYFIVQYIKSKTNGHYVQPISHLAPDQSSPVKESSIDTKITGTTRRRHSVTDQINRFHNIKLSEDKPKTQTKTSPQRSPKSQPIVSESTLHSSQNTID